MLFDVDTDRLADVCERYGIRSLMVFGSVAAGTAGPQSDVDLLYEIREGAHLGWEIEQLNDELDQIFGRHVDLVPRAYLNPRIKDRVLAQAQQLYAA